MLEVTKKRTVKTRKNHECFCCCEIIDKGAAAVHVLGKEDGCHVQFHMHVQCHIKVMKKKLFNEGFEKGQLKAAEFVMNDLSIDDTSCPF